MAEPEGTECVICYNDTLCDDPQVTQEQHVVSRSKICARCCVCQGCADGWVKKRCLTASTDTDIRCPCCMNTVDANVWISAIDPQTMEFLDDHFRQKFQVMCDEGCNHEFSVWRPAVEDIEGTTSSLLDFIKARPISQETKTNLMKACRKFGRGKTSAEDVLCALQAVFDFDEYLLTSVVWTGWGTGVSFPQLIRNPMKRVKFLEAVLEQYTRVACGSCFQETCYRCWRSYHGDGNTCHRVCRRECPQCGATIDRNGGDAYVTCIMCQHQFNWHDGMYHEDPDYFSYEDGAPYDG